MYFPEAVPPEDITSDLIHSDCSLPVTLQDFTDQSHNLKCVAKRHKQLKDFIWQMKHSQQEFLMRDQDLFKLLADADKNFLANNVHIYRFYFVTLVTILMSIILMAFTADHVRLKVLGIGLATNKIPYVEVMVQMKCESVLHWHI